MIEKMNFIFEKMERFVETISGVLSERTVKVRVELSLLIGGEV